MNPEDAAGYARLSAGDPGALVAVTGGAARGRRYSDQSVTRERG